MQQIGRFQVVGELGRGAMGIVYRALDPTIGRTIAIKCIRLTDLTDTAERDRLRERLFREAQSAGILSHPNIVTIYDIFEEGGLAYIFMEFVDGPPIEKLLADHTPDKSTLFAILRQTAGALDYAHKKGIVHRDIKPANIMLHDGTIAKITDFGVAKILSQQMTQTGTMMGTPSYMSPEQVQGGDITGRTDQFALAVIAYEMLTGERPFVADSLPSLLFKICRDDPAPPQRLNKTLAPEVESVLRRGLAKAAAERYLACVEFIDDLERTCNLRADWVPMARGASLNMPTVNTARPSLPPAAAQLSTTGDEETMVAPVSAGAPAEPAPAVPPPEVAVPPREPVRLEDGESHTARNVFLALASIVVVGLILLLAQKWFAPKPTPPPAVAENLTPSSAPNLDKPSPTPTSPARETSSASPASAPPLETEAAQPSESPEAKNATPVKPPESEEPVDAAAKAVTRPARSPRTPPSDATLRVMTSPPGARVVIDGQSQLGCRAPCTLTLSAGRHTLFAQAAGYRDANRILEIPRDADVSVDMERLGGTLAISSNLAGSIIYLNGQERPERTPVVLSLPVGTYQVHLVSGKLQCDTDPVRIQDGSIVRRACDMQ